MSLSITINNINDLTDAERAVLRLIVGDKQVTLTGPTATREFIESIAGETDEVLSPHVQVAEFPPANVAFLSGDKNPLKVDETERRYTAVPTPASAELDSAGLPWDKRIHSSSRAKVADGTWRKMRGVDDALVATVEAELRAVQAIPVPVLVNHDASQALPTDAVRVETENATPSTVTVTVPVPSAPVPPAPTATLAEMQAKLDAVAPVPVPPAPAPAAPLTFADLMKHVTPMLVAGKLSQDKLLAICAEVGLPHLAALGARPDLVEEVRARIDEVVG